MAVFRIEDPETWLPTFARGKSIEPSKVRLHHKDGSRSEHPVSGNPKQITTTDERAIRHLQADPRFTQIS